MKKNEGGQTWKDGRLNSFCYCKYNFFSSVTDTS